MTRPDQCHTDRCGGGQDATDNDQGSRSTVAEAQQPASEP
jgi:hypothetical protein